MYIDCLVAAAQCPSVARAYENAVNRPYAPSKPKPVPKPKSPVKSKKVVEKDIEMTVFK